MHTQTGARPRRPPLRLGDSRLAHARAQGTVTRPRAVSEAHRAPECVQGPLLTEHTRRPRPRAAPSCACDTPRTVHVYPEVPCAQRLTLTQGWCTPTAQALALCTRTRHALSQGRPAPRSHPCAHSRLAPAGHTARASPGRARTGNEPTSGRAHPAREDELAGDARPARDRIPRPTCCPSDPAGLPLSCPPCCDQVPALGPRAWTVIYSLSSAHEKLPELKTFIFCC